MNLQNVPRINKLKLISNYHFTAIISFHLVQVIIVEQIRNTVQLLSVLFCFRSFFSVFGRVFVCLFVCFLFVSLFVFLFFKVSLQLSCIICTIGLCLASHRIVINK